MRNAPYEDRIEEDGTIIIYEGHDEKKTKETPYPKLVDQPECTKGGTFTDNGKFHEAAQDYKKTKIFH